MRSRTAWRAASLLGWTLLLLFFVWTAALAFVQDSRESRKPPEAGSPARLLQRRPSREDSKEIVLERKRGEAPATSDARANSAASNAPAPGALSSLQGVLFGPHGCFFGMP